MEKIQRHQDQEAGASVEISLKRLFGAASSRTDELPDFSRFFMTRLKARIAETREKRQGFYSIGLAAKQMLPAFMALVVFLSGWTGVEHIRLERASRAVMNMEAGTHDTIGELMLTAFMVSMGLYPATPK